MPALRNTPPASATGYPLISVVMTTYNGVRFLAEQLESILGQSYTNFELIIADDCSSDATVEVLERFGARDNRISFYSNPTNLGVNQNLTIALSKARGQFIAIADQDDIWESTKLEVLLARMGSYSAVYSDSLLIDSAGRPLGVTLMERLKIERPVVENAVLALVRKNCISGHALLFRQDLLKVVLPFENELMFDHQIGIVAALNDGLGFVDIPLVRHRLHQENQTNSGLFAKSLHAHPQNKIQRGALYRERRMALVEILRVFLTHLEKHESHYSDSKHVSRVKGRAAKLFAGLKRFDEVWFDVRLFLLLFAIRKELFFSQGSHTFSRCMRYARGALYYQ